MSDNGSHQSGWVLVLHSYISISDNGSYQMSCALAAHFSLHYILSTINAMVSARSLLVIFLPLHTSAFAPIALWTSCRIVISNLNISSPHDDGTDQQKEISKADRQKLKKKKLDPGNDEYRWRRLDKKDEDYYYWKHRLDNEDYDNEDYAYISKRELMYDYDYYGEDYGFENVRFDLDLEDCEIDMDLSCGGMG